MKIEIYRRTREVFPTLISPTRITRLCIVYYTFNGLNLLDLFGWIHVFKIKVKKMNKEIYKYF